MIDENWLADITRETSRRLSDEGRFQGLDKMQTDLLMQDELSKIINEKRKNALAPVPEIGPPIKQMADNIINSDPSFAPPPNVGPPSLLGPGGINPELKRPTPTVQAQDSAPSFAPPPNVEAPSLLGPGGVNPELKNPTPTVQAQDSAPSFAPPPNVEAPRLIGPGGINPELKESFAPPPNVEAPRLIGPGGINPELRKPTPAPTPAPKPAPAPSPKPTVSAQDSYKPPSGPAASYNTMSTNNFGEKSWENRSGAGKATAHRRGGDYSQTGDDITIEDAVVGVKDAPNPYPTVEGHDSAPSYPGGRSGIYTDINDIPNPYPTVQGYAYAPTYPGGRSGFYTDTKDIPMDPVAPRSTDVDPVPTNGQNPNWGLEPEVVRKLTPGSVDPVPTDGQDPSWRLEPEVVRKLTPGSVDPVPTDGQDPSWRLEPEVVREPPPGSVDPVPTDGQDPSWTLQPEVVREPTPRSFQMDILNELRDRTLGKGLVSPDAHRASQDRARKAITSASRGYYGMPDSFRTRSGDVAAAELGQRAARQMEMDRMAEMEAASNLYTSGISDMLGQDAQRGQFELDKWQKMNSEELAKILSRAAIDRGTYALSLKDAEHLADLEDLATQQELTDYQKAEIDYLRNKASGGSATSKIGAALQELGGLGQTASDLYSKYSSGGTSNPYYDKSYGEESKFNKELDDLLKEWG